MFRKPILEEVFSLRDGRDLLVFSNGKVVFSLRDGRDLLVFSNGKVYVLYPGENSVIELEIATKDEMYNNG